MLALKMTMERHRFFTAIENGRLEIAKLLVRKGAQIDTCDLSRRTALHIAAEKGNMEAIAFSFR